MDLIWSDRKWELCNIKDSPQKALETKLRALDLFVETDLLWISSSKVTNFDLSKSITFVPVSNLWNSLKIIAHFLVQS